MIYRICPKYLPSFRKSEGRKECDRDCDDSWAHIWQVSLCLVGDITENKLSFHFLSVSLFLCLLICHEKRTHVPTISVSLRIIFTLYSWHWCFIELLSLCEFDRNTIFYFCQGICIQKAGLGAGLDSFSCIRVWAG